MKQQIVSICVHIPVRPGTTAGTLALRRSSVMVTM